MTVSTTVPPVLTNGVIDDPVDPYDSERDAPALVGIIGQSEAIDKVRALIGLHARYDAPVLITGKTGTGKELAARGLHYCGERQSQPFIPINCATLSDELFSSELFGHARGAFTDAKKDKKGLLAVADRGTLFLDEIDSLSLKSQAALLRFLQEKEYRPVGSEQILTSNARLVASANCDLKARIQRGAFREDLYYRLFILSIHMPALSQRQGDIPILVNHFIAQFHFHYQLGIKTATPALMALLSQRPWPGNIRELENLIHRLYLYCPDQCLSPERLQALESSSDWGEKGGQGECLPTELACSADREPDMAAPEYLDLDTLALNRQEQFSFNRDKKRAVEQFEKAYVTTLIERSKGNITLAAELCGKERRAFGKLVKKYRIREECEALFD